MNNDLASLVASANSILITLPDKPSFDEVAAGLAFYLSLKAAKETNIFCSSPMVVEFNRLIGVDKISGEMGNKNLTITFDKYPAENIERVSADVDGAEFKLTVIPKVGFTPPAKNQVLLGFSGVAVDLVTMIGGKDLSQFSALASSGLAGAKLVHIGVEPLAPVPERAIFSLVQPASSVSEVAAVLIKGSGFLLDADIATNLIAGIEEASGHLRGPEVTADTFDMFAQLLRSGGQRLEKGVAVAKKPAFVGVIPGQPARAADIATTPAVPKDWFEPKIYKGTGV